MSHYSDKTSEPTQPSKQPIFLIASDESNDIGGASVTSSEMRRMIIEKSLVTNDKFDIHQKFDMFGFLIGKNFQSVNVSDIYNNKPFKYTGSWIGGYGPHSNGTLMFPNDNINITTTFDHGMYIIENLPLNEIEMNGVVSSSYFKRNCCQTTVYHHILNNNCDAIKCYCVVEALSSKVRLARFDPNNIFTLQSNKKFNHLNLSIRLISNIAKTVVETVLHAPMPIPISSNQCTSSHSNSQIINNSSSGSQSIRQPTSQKDSIETSEIISKPCSEVMAR